MLVQWIACHAQVYYYLRQRKLLKIPLFVAETFQYIATYLVYTNVMPQTIIYPNANPNPKYNPYCRAQVSNPDTNFKYSPKIRLYSGLVLGLGTLDSPLNRERGRISRGRSNWVCARHYLGLLRSPLRC